MKKVAWLAAVVTLAATGSYIFVYLYRWEWHRALIVAMLFIAAEVAVSCSLVIRCVGKLDARLQIDRGQRAPVDPDIVERIRAAAPRRDHFPWLEAPVDRVGVFIPVLLGSGIAVSTVAWVVERLAGRTVEPSMERGLARQLSDMSFPKEGLVAEAEVLTQQGLSRHDECVALLLGPAPPR